MSVQQMITEHLDLWTAAHKTRSSAGRGSSNKLDLVGIKKLRELILELAVRGKLVPQDPNDEPASELIKKIATEKEQLIKEGKIKKQKPLPEIAEEERPFELPCGWVWARFGEIFELEYGNNLPEPKRTGTGEYAVYGSNGIVGTHNEACIASPCIIVGRKGSAGALNICFENGCWVTDVAYSVVPPKSMYLNFVFQQFHTLGLEVLGKGIKPGLNRNEAYILVIALPPLAEQHRIVAKVDELMAFCDQLEQSQTDNIAAHEQLVEALLATLINSQNSEDLQANWQRLAIHFDTLFTTEHSIDQLKQTILQLAVMGKLVPQNPNDEPASELLKKIALEKERLIKEGKIKKQKPLPEITEKNKLLELPEGWEIARFGRITFNRDFERVPLSVDERSARKGQYDYYGASGVIDGIDDYLFDKPLMLIGEDGANLLSRSTPIAFMAYGKYWVNNHAHVLDGLSESFLLYLCLYINSISLAPYVTGTAQPKMNQEKMNSIVVALPPEQEQHRIVTKVEELMTLCDTLKSNLQNAQTTQLALANALVEQAVN